MRHRNWIGAVRDVSYKHVMLVSCLLSLSMIAYVASFSTLAADDFVRGVNFSNKGLFGSLLYEYSNWDGRFISFFIEYLIAPLLRKHAAYPALLILFNIFTIIFLSLSVNNVYGDLRKSILIAICVYILLWVNSRNPADSLFWMTGFIENILSVSICIFVLSCFLQLVSHGTKPSLLHQLFLGFGVFVACGFHELYSVALLGLLLCAICATFLRDRKIYLWTVIIWVCGAIAFLIVISAPGNAVRATHFADLHPIPVWLVKTAAHTAGASMVHVITAIQTLAGVGLVLLCSDGVADRKTASPADITGITLLCLMMVMAMFLAPTLLSGYLAPRTQDGITLYLLMMLLYITSLCAGPARTKINVSLHTKTVFSLLLSSIWLLNTVLSQNGKSIFMSSFDNIWSFQAAMEQRRAFLESLAGRSDASVALAPIPPLPRVTFRADITTDSNHWINQAVARYYGLGEVYLCTENAVSFGQVAAHKPAYEILAP